MRLPYKKALEAATLYKTGVSYHAFGVIKQGKSAMFDYYKADSITEDQIATLKQFCPDMQVAGMRSQYAPELRSVCIMFPKAAWYRANVSI